MRPVRKLSPRKTLREDVNDVLLAALGTLSESDLAMSFHHRETTPARRRIVSKALILNFYQKALIDLGTVGELMALDRARLHEYLRAAGFARSLREATPALCVALSDLNKVVHPESRGRVRLRTTGALVIDAPPGASLDAPAPVPEGDRRVEVRGTVRSGVIRLPAMVRVRDGADARISLVASDVIDGDSEENPVHAGALTAMIGAVRLGGDALDDSRHPFGR